MADSLSDNEADEDEVDWVLDDAARSLGSSPAYLPSKTYGADALPTVESLVETVVAQCHTVDGRTAQLPCPVIVPQRRPGSMSVGFIRAYAPVLADSGISQYAFLSLLENFEEASRASPLLNVVYVGTRVIRFTPEPACKITSVVVGTAVKLAIQQQQRFRTNSFLDQINKRLLMPRGLYALVMS